MVGRHEPFRNRDQVYHCLQYKRNEHDAGMVTPRQPKGLKRLRLPRAVVAKKEPGGADWDDDEPEAQQEPGEGAATGGGGRG